MFNKLKLHKQAVISHNEHIDNFMLECALMKLEHYYNADDIVRILNAIRCNTDTLISTKSTYTVKDDSYKKV